MNERKLVYHDMKTRKLTLLYVGFFRLTDYSNKVIIEFDDGSLSAFSKSEHYIYEDDEIIIIRRLLI